MTRIHLNRILWRRQLYISESQLTLFRCKVINHTNWKSIQNLFLFSTFANYLDNDAHKDSVYVTTGHRSSLILESFRFLKLETIEVTYFYHPKIHNFWRPSISCFHVNIAVFQLHTCHCEGLSNFKYRHIR